MKSKKYSVEVWVIVVSSIAVTTLYSQSPPEISLPPYSQLPPEISLPPKITSSSTSSTTTSSSETTSTTTTSSSETTSTTTGRPVPEIKPTPSTVVTAPPATISTESEEKGMHKADMNILKWLLANDPEKPLEGIGIRTQIVRALLKTPHIREALEALRQKLQNLDSQDPNDPEVQKIVKEFRTTLMRHIAQIKLRNLQKRKAKTVATAPKQIVGGQLPEHGTLPLPARPVIVPEHKTIVTEPPTTTSESTIEPPTTSSSTTTTSTTTTTTQPKAGTIDPITMALLTWLQQFLQQQQQQANAPQEIKDLAETLRKASDKCKEELAKKSGGSSLLNEIKSLLSKNPPSDSDKERAKELKSQFCDLAKGIPDCSGVCDGGGGTPSNPLDNCRTSNTSCGSCPNSDAKAICEFYKSNVLNKATANCRNSIGQYADAAWFNQFLTNKPSDSEISSKRQEMKNSICAQSDCREALAASGSNFCN